jgi:hypothetical protein
MRLSLLAFSLVATLAATACAPASGREPVVASSSGQPSYALRYGDTLAAATKSIGDARTEVRAIAAGLPARADDLKKPDWELVLAVVDASDAAGKSADLVDAHSEVEGVRTFWSHEKDAITAKVSGNAQYAVKQANCSSADAGGAVGGAVAYALHDSLESALQKRLRASNDAFLLIERNKAALGAQNTTSLEKLADDVAQASYLVHVALVVDGERLRRLLADKGGAASTLDRFTQDEKAFQSQPGRSDADKKASGERIVAAGRARANLDAAAAQAEPLMANLKEEVDQSTRDYETALKALRDKIAERKNK